MMLEQDLDQEGYLRSKSNPFQDLPHDTKATVFQKGFLKRKAHADIDGKRSESQCGQRQVSSYICSSLS